MKCCTLRSRLQLIVRKLPPLPLRVGAKQRLELLPLLVCDAGGEGHTVGDPQIAATGLQGGPAMQQSYEEGSAGGVNR